MGQCRPLGFGQGPDPTVTPRMGCVDAATVRSRLLEGPLHLNPPLDNTLPWGSHGSTWAVR